MKPPTKSLATVLAVAGGLALAGSAHAQYTTNVISNFQNFNLSATYANWDAAGSQTINGGSGYTPTLTSGATPGSFEVNAEAYGSGAYNFPVPIDDPSATEAQLTFTLNPDMNLSSANLLLMVVMCFDEVGFLSPLTLYSEKLAAENPMSSFVPSISNT